MDTLSILTSLILGFPIVCRATCTQSSDWILANFNDISTGCFCLILVLRQVFCPVNEFNLDFINPRSQIPFQTPGGLELMTVMFTVQILRAHADESTFNMEKWDDLLHWPSTDEFLCFIPIKGLLRVIWIIQTCLSMVFGSEKPPCS